MFFSQYLTRFAGVNVGGRLGKAAPAVVVGFRLVRQ